MLFIYHCKFTRMVVSLLFCILFLFACLFLEQHHKCVSLLNLRRPIYPRSPYPTTSNRRRRNITKAWIRALGDLRRLLKLHRQVTRLLICYFGDIPMEHEIMLRGHPSTKGVKTYFMQRQSQWSVELRH